MAKKHKRRRKKRGSGFSILLALTVLVTSAAWWYWNNLGPDQPIDGQLEVHVIDVGQGDSILLRSGTETMLIDSGLRETGDDVSRYLQEQGIRKLDRVLITHDHSDHTGGLKRVLRDLDTELLMLYDGGDRESGYLLAGELAGSSSCDIAFVEAGQQFPLGEAIVKVLFPTAGYYSDDQNDMSVVLLVECGGKRLLLTGDSTAEAEAEYWMKLPKIDVLKVGHHGSSGSSSEKLLLATRPEFALISCGRDNDYGHPHDRVLQTLKGMGAKVFRTDLQGDLVVTLQNGDLSVRTGR
jgi:competence protein ComEC